ncbi:hypothetical protein [Enterococcus faecalis]|uniref:hypothetical protein n=1 Tax=Enterococcus faecalis TaxID=1351 RepID=UPI0022E13B41|nr:hypothetical protein [Enterococcus faecalis]
MRRSSYVDNGSDKLIIVFQSAGRVPTEKIKAYLNKNISDQDIKKFHGKYNWYSMAKRMPIADYYFLEDHYSGIYGWYISDFGKNIISTIQNEIENIVSKKEYKMVIAFGSSKGGTGALIHGLISPYISKIFTLVPQINITRYIEEHLPEIKHLLMPMESKECNEELMGNIMNYLDISKIKRRKTVFFYTGILDEQFAETRLFSRKISSELISSTLIMNVERKGHSPMIMDNVEFIEKVLSNILNQTRTEDDDLFKIDPKTFLYLGKSKEKVSEK